MRTTRTKFANALLILTLATTATAAYDGIVFPGQNHLASNECDLWESITNRSISYEILMTERVRRSMLKMSITQYSLKALTETGPSDPTDIVPMECEIVLVKPKPLTVLAPWIKGEPDRANICFPHDDGWSMDHWTTAIRRFHRCYDNIALLPSSLWHRTKRAYYNSLIQSLNRVGGNDTGLLFG